MGDGRELITDERDNGGAYLPQEDTEHEEFCVRAANSLVADIKQGGLPEINGCLSHLGYKIVRVE